MSPDKMTKENKETAKWLSTIIHSDYIHSSLQLKLAQSIQYSFDKLITDDIKKTVSSVKVVKTSFPNPSFTTVKTVDSEGTIVSTLSIDFSSAVTIDTKITLAATNKTIKSVATVSTVSPTVRITIPHEVGLIKIEFFSGADSKITFQSEENVSQLKSLEAVLSQAIKHITLEFDVDTVPEEPTQPESPTKPAKTEKEEVPVIDERGIKLNDEEDQASPNQQQSSKPASPKASPSPKSDNVQPKQPSPKQPQPSQSESVKVENVTNQTQNAKENSSSSSDSSDDEEVVTSSISMTRRTILVNDENGQASQSTRQVSPVQNGTFTQIVQSADGQSLSAVRTSSNHEQSSSQNQNHSVVEAEDGSKLTNVYAQASSHVRDEANLHAVHAEEGENYRMMMQLKASQMHQEDHDVQHNTSVQEDENGILITHETIMTTTIEHVEETHVQTVIQQQVTSSQLPQ
ncbi:hypothetical protein TRFO_13455 [Tritrichomonas foetus]|uniref:Uncharacterized protein n=1 Tax=Tritrichomonas foetus TaxID=1144522 RepID=A0A1J4KZ38_9EUKA|nr:hypothetical protein TRFO_13455 [Tritrichomonas foetus]|eukprot:OHT16128.1 hypothetical protein TRFO_13455 [Tritrichomonas foetus]